MIEVKESESKETFCAKCAHEGLCIYQSLLEALQKSIDSVEIDIGPDRTMLLGDIIRITPIEVACSCRCLHGKSQTKGGNS